LHSNYSPSDENADSENTSETSTVADRVTNTVIVAFPYTFSSSCPFSSSTAYSIGKPSE
jgi:hypothetical protein